MLGSLGSFLESLLPIENLVIFLKVDLSIEAVPEDFSTGETGEVLPAVF